MQFHHESRYYFRVGGAEAHVTTTCGIKQRCRVAPYLFIALTLTIQIMDCRASTLGTDWLRTGFTCYADDALVQWQITSASELIAAMRGVQAVIDAFNLNGMKMSPSKSVILLDLHGADAKKMMRKAMRNNTPGAKDMADDPRPHQRIARLPGHHHLLLPLGYPHTKT